MSEAMYRVISEAVMEGEKEEAVHRVNQALEAGMPPAEVMQRGIVDGINKTGERWNANDVFLPEVISVTNAFRAAMAVVEPHLSEGERLAKGRKIVIGSVHGDDVHDYGKSIVTAMWTAVGFEVIDLGINVPLERFIEAAQEHRPDIIGLGAYKSTTMMHMKDVIAGLEERDLRKNLKVMVGGVPTSQEFADEIGADAWGRDAVDALNKALAL